jgi:LPXTG-motif cell wall-anchored protein
MIRLALGFVTAHPAVTSALILAHTGTEAPVGLISGIAGALAVAGGVLVWWMRRRRTAQG